MSLVNIKIEGQPYQVEAGLTILEAAKACGYEIPSLCAFFTLCIQSWRVQPGFMPCLLGRSNRRKRTRCILRISCS